jgi:predicted nucleotidyltransferase
MICNFENMDREQVLSSLREHLSEIKKRFGAEELALFGSIARNQQKPDSDIDILVKMERPDFALLMSLQRFLESKLNSKIDFNRVGNHLTERFYNIIGKDIIYV